jgi:hypothetical protein
MVAKKIRDFTPSTKSAGFITTQDIKKVNSRILRKGSGLATVIVSRQASSIKEIARDMGSNISRKRINEAWRKARLDVPR